MNSQVILKQVCKEYRMGSTTVQALRGVDISLDRGGYYSIVGPSGSGKSTLLHILGCMDLPTRGEVWLGEQAVHEMPEARMTALRAGQIGFIFQAFHLNPILTARENVAIALRFIGKTRKEANRLAEEWLTRVGLGHRLNHYPSELSGGERQRVAIARAVAKEPLLILADEPTGNLDSKTGLEIIHLLREINQQAGTTIIQVTHDLEIAALSDEVVNLRDGMVVN